MSDDDALVRRLRNTTIAIQPIFPTMRHEAADVIERLVRERDHERAMWAKADDAEAAASRRAEAAERKVEKLRAAIHSAYVEGWTDATSWDDPKEPGVIDQEWETSLARAALNETEK